MGEYKVICRERGGLTAQALVILQRVIIERSGLTVSVSDTGEASLIFDICSDEIGLEGYRISDTASGALRISGGCGRGLLYGVGRFLHEARFSEGCVVPGAWRGTSVPQCSLRGIYLALHQNYYSFAPVAELVRYIEELALWGLNTVAFHLPIPLDPDAPAAQAAHERHRTILKGAKAAGMRVALLDSINCGDIDAPQAAYAPQFPDSDPPRRGHSGIRVCPSHHEGFAYLSLRMARYLDGYEDIGIDYIVAFPYDSGGCGCEACRPWGSGGFLKISREFVRLARQRYPAVKFILGTWCYDVCDESEGEWQGLTQALANENGWVDYIMADSHFDFPDYPLRHGVPGDLPLINFAEISMWGRYPWGAYGANPLPARFERIWRATEGKLDGGLPYSEGIFEDINKVIFAHLFWDKNTNADDAVRNYITYEFGVAALEPITTAVSLLEQNYLFAEWQQSGVAQAHDLILQADTMLDERARKSWRWRLLYLRAVIDFELIKNNRVPSARCEAAYDELITISRLEEGWGHVTPRTQADRTRRAARERQGRTAQPPGHEAIDIAPPIVTGL